MGDTYVAALLLLLALSVWTMLTCLFWPWHWPVRQHPDWCMCSEHRG